MGSLNIGVIISGINEEYQNSILNGIHEYAGMNDIDISHFVAFGGVLGGKKNDIGEFNIYNLINYDVFQGVIILTNTITSQTMTNEIIEKLRKADIPVSSIDYDIDGFSYVGIDNYKAMREIVEHIAVYHEVSDIGFISGPDKNPENILRFKAYTDVLNENGIPLKEENIYHGLFRERDGIEAVEHFIKSGRMPRALVCANDAMAIGAIQTLVENGYNVPEDVYVTGFDNIFNARNYIIPITSVNRPLRRSGFIACSQVHNEILNRKNGIRGERKVSVLDTNIINAMSCGCSHSICDDISLFKKETYMLIDMYHYDVPLINQMSCSLAECDTFDDFKECLKKYVEMIKCEKFYMFLCDDWLGEKVEDENRNNYLVSGYTDTVSVPLVYINDHFGSLEDMSSVSMLPDLYTSPEGFKNYYFSPLHFNDRCLGYIVICNSKFPLESALFHSWVINISNAIENIRKSSYIERTLKVLEGLYTIDPLSQIYNRNGLHVNADEEFDRCKNEKVPVMIMFADMDGMKRINDTFGHKEGDFAIKVMASSINEACSDNEICARFGGDEFIVFASGYTNDKAEKLKNRIQANIERSNKIYEKPYDISISIGWEIKVPDEKTTMYSLVTCADQKMYVEKKNKPYRR